MWGAQGRLVDGLDGIHVMAGGDPSMALVELEDDALVRDVMPPAEIQPVGRHADAARQCREEVGVSGFDGHALDTQK